VGRHRAPSSESAALPRAPIAIAAAAVAVVLALFVGVFVATRGGGDDGVTAQSTTATRTSQPPSATSPAPSASSSATASASASAPATVRPPTLMLTMTGASYVSVRTPNGRTLAAQLFHKGAQKRFDQKELRVTIGNSAAVRVSINGKARKPGRRGQVETFTVRRK
jgi:cytoskeletal protein RodZ